MVFGQCPAGNSVGGASLDESEDDSAEEEPGGDQVRTLCDQGKGLRQDNKAAAGGGSTHGPLPVRVKLLRDSVGGGSEGVAEEDVGSEPCEEDISIVDNIIFVEEYEEMIYIT